MLILLQVLLMNFLDKLLAEAIMLAIYNGQTIRI